MQRPPSHTQRQGGACGARQSSACSRTSARIASTRRAHRNARCGSIPSQPAVLTGRASWCLCGTRRPDPGPCGWLQGRPGPRGRAENGQGLVKHRRSVDAEGRMQTCGRSAGHTCDSSRALRRWHAAAASPRARAQQRAPSVVRAKIITPARRCGAQVGPARGPAVRPWVEPLRSYLRCRSRSVRNTLFITTKRTCGGWVGWAGGVGWGGPPSSGRFHQQKGGHARRGGRLGTGVVGLRVSEPGIRQQMFCTM